MLKSLSRYAGAVEDVFCTFKNAKSDQAWHNSCQQCRNTFNCVWVNAPNQTIGCARMWSKSKHHVRCRNAQIALALCLCSRKHVLQIQKWTKTNRHKPRLMVNPKSNHQMWWLRKCLRLSFKSSRLPMAGLESLWTDNIRLESRIESKSQVSFLESRIGSKLKKTNPWVS